MRRIVKLIYIAMSYLFLGMGQLYAQETEIRVIHKVDQDKLILRWSPVDATSWLHMNKVGVEIAFLSFDTTDLELGEFQVLDSCVKPWSLEVFEKASRIDTVDHYTAVVGQCLHAPYETILYGVDINAKLKQKEELESRYSMTLLASDLSRNASFASGMRAEFRIDTSKDYFYRLVIKSDSVQFDADTTYFQVIPQEVLWPKLAPDLEVAYEGEKMVSLSWDRLVNEDFFTAYLIEKSVDGGNTFTQVNEQPYISSTPEGEDYVFLDSLQENYLPYYYRLIGIDPFAKRSAASAPVLAMGRDRTPPPGPTNLAISLDTNGVLISWNCDSVVSDLGGFVISRSPWMDRGYEPLDSVAAIERNYLDQWYDVDTRNYRVSAFDTSGNISHSNGIYLFVIDSIAPRIPQWVGGSIDSLGNVSLDWQLGKEDDLKGYKVMYAHHPDHVFTPISKALYFDTTLNYQINLYTLSEQIYFKLVAVDMYYNHSDFSELLMLKIPDAVPPTKPIFTSYLVDEKMISLTWTRSTSKDVNKHILLRKHPGHEFQPIFESTDNRSTAYIDTLIQSNTAYQYIILAVDDDGNQSESNDTLYLQSRKLLPRPPTTSIQLIKKADGVEISWDNQMKSEYRFKLYRKINEFSPRAFTSTSAGFYLDTGVKSGNTYTYWLQIIDADGNSSEFSEPKKIVY